MSTHTPGPWQSRKYANNRNGNSFQIQALPNAGWGATITCLIPGMENGGTSDRIEEICEANARLIASAPELVTALKEATSFLKHGLGQSEILIRQCEAALAKAEG